MSGPTQDIYPRRHQKTRQRYQRQPLQGSRVAPLKPLKQSNPQPLTLETARAVVGFLLAQVGLDFLPGEAAELDLEGLGLRQRRFGPRNRIWSTP